MEQTLTCTIGGLDASHPVEVVWEDPDSGTVSDTDTGNYSVAQGSVDADGIQNAVLTIKPVKLTSLVSGGSTSFTYTCSVKSTQYGSSPASDAVDVVANVLSLGRLPDLAI